MPSRRPLLQTTLCLIALQKAHGFQPSARSPALSYRSTTSGRNPIAPFAQKRSNPRSLLLSTPSVDQVPINGDSSNTNQQASSDATGTDQQEMSDAMATALSSPPSSSTLVDPPIKKFRFGFHDLFVAALVGIMTGMSVSLFKVSIRAVKRTLYGSLTVDPTAWRRIIFMPAVGGLLVSLLKKMGPMPPGLRGMVKEVDESDVMAADQKKPTESMREHVMGVLASIRNSMAAVVTLGSGCSLGPEGPCVEIGMSLSRACIETRSTAMPLTRRQGWNRLLLACGASAGVAAGFNAPMAGVFFALEIVQNAFDAIDDGKSKDNPRRHAELTLPATERISPVLLSSVLAALVSRGILGEHSLLHLTGYSLKNTLPALPLYLGLGFTAGCVAFTFSEIAKLSSSFFKGKAGPSSVKKTMKKMPKSIKPIIGGLFCGAAGYLFPQTQFLGYGTLNNLLANKAMPTLMLLSLLAVKMTTTAFAAGSGLVGGTFAPSLFFGAMVGGAFHNVVSAIPALAAGVADVPAYTMIGAASALSALFRAPLTASMLMFELTKDYEVILPLMASAGLGSLVADVLDDKFEKAKDRRRDNDPVSWGDLADDTEEPAAEAPNGGAAPQAA